MNYFNFIYIIIILILISIIMSLIVSLIDKTNVKEYFNYFTCTMTLNDVNPRFKKDYLSFHNRTAKCGDCENALIKLNVNTCPTDENGSPSPYCKPSGFIESSLGNPITFKYDISPQNMKKFFCINNL
jgi:hypothetical protein